jgi:uncharacterized protein YbjQ (UPF0145 family)
MRRALDSAYGVDPGLPFLKAQHDRHNHSSIEGKRITRYCGVVAGEAILGANVFKDFFAGIRDIVGGRSGTYERELQKAREIALKELEQRAAEAGANAVVGVDLDFEVLGQGNGMLMVSASGGCRRGIGRQRLSWLDARKAANLFHVQLHIFGLLRNL